MVSYLVKYVAGKESRPYVDFNVGKKDGEVHVDATNNDHINQKISGIRIRNEDKSKDSKLKNDNVMEVSMMEVCHNVLDYDYTYSNATFVHVNTMPPEFRFSSKKYKCVIESHKERALTLNPNNCRDHLTQHWRKFTQHQINHAKEYLNSSLHCWGATEKFNVRPPELRIFSNVSIYTKVFKTFSKLTELDEIIKGDLETSTFVDALDNECKIISCSIDSRHQFFLE